MDKVYVVIPMYNAIDFIDNALNSVLLQKNVNVKAIVVDHGSADQSYKYVEDKYENEKRVVIIGLKRIPGEIKSASRPLNAGMRYVEKHCDNGDWVMRLDADDVLVNNNTIYDTLQRAAKNVCLIAGSMYFINTDRKTAQEYCQDSRYDSVKCLRKNAAYAYPHHSTLISVNLLKRIIQDDGFCYYEKIGYGEDLDYTLRLLAYCDDNTVSFTRVPMIIKELSGETISNSVNLKTLLHDHICVFKRNTCLSKIFLIRIVLWYLFENAGSAGRKINRIMKPPALKFSVSKKLDYNRIHNMKIKWEHEEFPI